MASSIQSKFKERPLYFERPPESPRLNTGLLDAPNPPFDEWPSLEPREYTRVNYDPMNSRLWQKFLSFHLISQRRFPKSAQEEKPYSCPAKDCGARCVTKKNLRTHIIMKHPSSQGVILDQFRQSAKMRKEFPLPNS